MHLCSSADGALSLSGTNNSHCMTLKNKWNNTSHHYRCTEPISCIIYTTLNSSQWRVTCHSFSESWSADQETEEAVKWIVHSIFFKVSLLQWASASKLNFLFCLWEVLISCWECPDIQILQAGKEEVSSERLWQLSY